jgi:hypothetical protein
VGVHFFKNFRSPFGECSKAVHIADDTFNFFFFRLTGRVEFILLVNVRLADFFAPMMLKLLMAELGLSIMPSVSVVARVFSVCSTETCSELRDDGDKDIPISDGGRLSESESDV